MFYPNHHIRTYCIYLGSYETLAGQKFDLGVYIHPDKSVSHATVFGPKDYEYFSGEFIFQGKWIEKEFSFKNTLDKIVESLYILYSEMPIAFPQPDCFKQR